MVELTDKDYLTAGDATEAEFQEGLGALYDFVSQLAMGAKPEYPEIIDGLLTPLFSCFIVTDTENDTVTDDLDNISAVNIGTKTIFLKTTSNARALTLRHMRGGSGQIYLAGEANLTMDNKNYMIALRYDDVNDRWEELWRNWGIFTPTSASRAAARTALGLGSVSTLTTGTGETEVPTNGDLSNLAFKDSLTHSSDIENGVITPAKFAVNSPNLFMGWDGAGNPVAKAVQTVTYVRHRFRWFNSGSHTWVVPANVYSVKATLVAAGGGGGGKYNDSGGTTGGNGGNTSLMNGSSALALARGGQAGGFNSGGTHGQALSGNVVPSGGFLGHGTYNPYGGYATQGTGGGNGARNGGIGAQIVCIIDTTELQGQTLNITVGTGGAGGGGGSGTPGTNGASGIMVLEWFEAYSPT